MVSVKRIRLLFGLIVILTCASALCQEPNQPKTELKFEVSSEEQQWITEQGDGRGPIRPTYVAVLFIRQPHYMPNFTQPAAMEKMVNTSSGKLLSQKQHDFIPLAQAFCRLNLTEYVVPNHYHFRLYAVSELDARNMAQAFIENLTNIANTHRQQLLTEQQELQKGIALIKNKISDSEEKLKAAEARLDEMKGKIHYLTIDEAEKAILELNKMLCVLDVEIAGLQAKVSAIEKYKLGTKVTHEDTLAKLEQMLSEQAIELAGALARKEAGTEIRDRAEDFYNLRRQQIELPKTLDDLRRSLSNRRRSLSEVQDKLSDPASNALPPKVYQNKVAIYPVVGE